MYSELISPSTFIIPFNEKQKQRKKMFFLQTSNDISRFETIELIFPSIYFQEYYWCYFNGITRYFIFVTYQEREWVEMIP